MVTAPRSASSSPTRRALAASVAVHSPGPQTATWNGTAFPLLGRGWWQPTRLLAGHPAQLADTPEPSTSPGPQGHRRHPQAPSPHRAAVPRPPRRADRHHPAGLRARARSSRVGSHRVADLRGGPHPAGMGAMGAAVEPALHLHPAPDDLAEAVFAYWRQALDGALERVERVDLSGRVDLERHPVVVAAHLACRHTGSLRHLARGGNRSGERGVPGDQAAGSSSPVTVPPASGSSSPDRRAKSAAARRLDTGSGVARPWHTGPWHTGPWHTGPWHTGPWHTGPGRMGPMRPGPGGSRAGGCGRDCGEGLLSG